ncbi:MAG TPA: tetratricopeptide repeat protein, partial [Chitinophagaceae bacterium]|nr:tetratricopeptide repeat protein [Chitinophagaceae bacterium]
MRTLLLGTALLTLTAVSHAQSDSSSFFLQKALEEKGKGRHMESLKQLEKAYAFNKSNKEVVAELASTYNTLRRYGQARTTYQQLEQLGDRSPATLKQLMLLSFNMRQFDDVVKYAQELKKADPAEKVAYYIGKAHNETENYGEAIKFLTVAAEEDPQNAEVPYLVARAYADMNNYKQAIPFFQKAVSTDPKQSRWIYEMALIYYAMHDDANALKYMLEAGEKGLKRDNEYLENLGIAYLNTGNFEQGIAIMKEMLQRRPTDANLLNMLAEAHYDAKKYPEAIEYWDQVFGLDKENAKALYMIGMAYQKKGEKEKGASICDRAIQMDPSLNQLKQ